MRYIQKDIRSNYWRYGLENSLRLCSRDYSHVSVNKVVIPTSELEVVGGIIDKVVASRNGDLTLKTSRGTYKFFNEV